MSRVYNTEKILFYKFMGSLGDIESTPRTEIIRNIFATQKIYVPNIEKLNDPFEGIMALANKSTDTQKGVLSLTTQHQNILMWSHYADSFRGVALVLKVTNYSKLKLQKVQYLEKLNEINLLKEPLTAKHKSWSYENEYRFITDESNQEHTLESMGLIIDGIICAPKCPHREFLKNLAFSFDKNYGDLSLSENYGVDVHYTSKLNYIRYELMTQEFKEVNDMQEHDEQSYADMIAREEEEVINIKSSSQWLSHEAKLEAFAKKNKLKKKE
jgi:hypothetical protein